MPDPEDLHGDGAVAEPHRSDAAQHELDAQQAAAATIATSVSRLRAPLTSPLMSAPPAPPTGAPGGTERGDGRRRRSPPPRPAGRRRARWRSGPSRPRACRRCRGDRWPRSRSPHELRRWHHRCRRLDRRLRLDVPAAQRAGGRTGGLDQAPEQEEVLVVDLRVRRDTARLAAVAEDPEPPPLPDGHDGGLGNSPNECFHWAWSICRWAESAVVPMPPALMCSKNPLAGELGARTPARCSRTTATSSPRRR